MLGGGGRHRIEEGARLVLAGQAPWLVVTNTRVSWPGVRASYAELMAQEAQWQGVPAQRILRAPGLVTTTVEEAHAIRALAAERGWRSVLTADGGRQSAVSGRQSAVGSRQSAVGSRQSAVGSRQSAVGGQQSAVGGQQSAVGGQQSAVGGQQSAVGSRRQGD